MGENQCIANRGSGRSARTPARPRRPRARPTARQRANDHPHGRNCERRPQPGFERLRLVPHCRHYRLAARARNSPSDMICRPMSFLADHSSSRSRSSVPASAAEYRVSLPASATSSCSKRTPARPRDTVARDSLSSTPVHRPRRTCRPNAASPRSSVAARPFRMSFSMSCGCGLHRRAAHGIAPRSCANSCALSFRRRNCRGRGHVVRLPPQQGLHRSLALLRADDRRAIVDRFRRHTRSPAAGSPSSATTPCSASKNRWRTVTAARRTCSVDRLAGPPLGPGAVAARFPSGSIQVRRTHTTSTAPSSRQHPRPLALPLGSFAPKQHGFCRAFQTAVDDLPPYGRACTAPIEAAVVEPGRRVRLVRQAIAHVLAQPPAEGSTRRWSTASPSIGRARSTRLPGLRDRHEHPRRRSEPRGGAAHAHAVSRADTSSRSLAGKRLPRGRARLGAPGRGGVRGGVARAASTSAPSCTLAARRTTTCSGTASTSRCSISTSAAARPRCGCSGWNRRAVTSFHDDDHIDIRALLADNEIDLGRGGDPGADQSPVLGYVFNPVSFWWCRHGDGSLAVHRGRGEQHVRRAAPLRPLARLRRAKPAVERCSRPTSACTCRRSCRWIRPTRGGSPSRGRSSAFAWTCTRPAAATSTRR